MLNEQSRVLIPEFVCICFLKMSDSKKPLLSSSDSEEGPEITNGKNKRELKQIKPINIFPSSCTWFRFVCVFGIAVHFLVVILFIVKFVEVDHQVDALSRDNEFLRGRVFSMEFLTQRLAVIANKTDGVPNDVNLRKTGIRPTQNTEHDLQESFEEMKGHLNAITFVAGNLSVEIRKMNASSDSKLSRLWSKLKAAQHDITRLQSKLVQLNKSVHTDTPPSFVSAVKILNQELRMLRNSSLRNISEIWERLNRTNASIEGILKLIAKRNETSRLEIAYRPENLYSRMKHVEKMQTELHKDADDMFKEIRSKLNQGKDQSERQRQNFNKQIAGVNESLHKALEIVEDSIASLRSSLAGIDKKADGIKKELQNSIDGLTTEQRKITYDFQKTIDGFQEKHRNIDSAISGQATEVRGIKGNIKTLEYDLGSAKERVSKLEESEEEIQEKNNNQDSKIKDLQDKLNRMKTKQDKLNLQMEKNKGKKMPRIDIIPLLLVAIGLTFLQ